MKTPIKVPASVRKLVWWAKADPMKNKKQLLTAIFNRGEVKDVRWALRTYSKRILRDTIRNPLSGSWDKRSFACISGVLGVEVPKKTKEKAISSLWK